MKRNLTREIRRAPQPAPHALGPDEFDTTGCTDSDQPKPKPTPEWVLLRPFQYNGRVLAAALPGLCLVLSLAGELLLSIIVIGALFVHLVDSAGAKRQSLIIFLCFLIAAQMSIIYSAIPVVWISLLNIMFLFILNIFVVLTGGWVLLHFELLLREEPVLADLIEASLFTIYPAVSVILTSWMIGTMLSTKYLHYVVILQGFLLLRLFITPNQPSFRKPTHRASQTGIAYVIGAPEIALLLIFYSIAPTVIFIIFNFWNPTKYVAIELVHVISTPVFLASFLELRSWTEHAGIPFRTISIVRWIAGFVSLISTCIILIQTKSSVLVPWLLPVTIGNVILGSLSNHKGSTMRALTHVLAVAVGFMYTLAILDGIPWNLDTPEMDLWWMSVVLIACAVLSISCFLVANAGNKQLLSTLLICQMAVVVYIEYMLFHHKLCSAPLLVGTATCAIYLLTRLHNAGVIAWHATWLGSALHSIKLLPFLQSLNSDSIEPTWFRSAIVLFLVLVTSKLIFFEKRKEMPVLTVYYYVLAICSSVTLFYFTVLRRLWLAFAPAPPTIQDATSVFIIVCSAICLKLTFCHMYHLPSARKANVLTTVAGMMLLVLQPTIPKSLVEVSDWLIIITPCVILGTASGLIPPSQNWGLLLLQSLMVGLAAGVNLTENLLGSHPHFTSTLLYTLSCTTCAFIAFSVWNWNLAKDLKRATKIPDVTTQFVVLVVITTVTLMAEGSALPMGNVALSSLALPCTQLYCGIYLFTAVILQVHCVWQKSRDPFNYLSGNIPTLINIAAIVCYLLAIINCPIEPWEIWNCTCAIVLLLLQPDPVLMTSLPEQKQSGILLTICMANLYVASAIHCDLWYNGLGFFCLMELLILALVFPVYVVLGSQFCSNYVASPEIVVFITPLNSILYVVGSSYTSWLLATVGLSAGTWVIVYKISNETVRK